MNLTKILIVDDNKNDLNGLVDFTPWKRLECSVCATARNGKDGLEQAMSMHPDIIIADISMPIMSGIEMCIKVREQQPSIPFIFISCLEDFEHSKNIINLGNCYYISKPVDIDNVIECILKIKQMHESEIKKEITLYELEQQITSNLPTFTENFFRNLFHNFFATPESITKSAKRLGIDTELKYSMVLFRLDEDYDNIYIAIQQLINVITSTLFSSSIGYCIEYKTNALALIADSTLFISPELLSSIADNLEDTLNCKVNICIGHSSISLYDIPVEFCQCNDALEADYFNTAYKIVYADEFSKKGADNTNIDIMEMSDSVSLIINDPSENNIIEFVEKYINHNAADLSKITALYIISFLCSIIDKSDTTIDTGFIIDKANNTLRALTTNEEIESDVRDIIIHIISNLSDNDNETNNIIMNIKNVIDNDYAVITALDDIADKVHVSLSYACRLFKAEMGFTIYEYLLNIRMRKAKLLLSTTSLRVQEIAAAVGYSNNTYFSTVFKSYAGMTPLQYRQKTT